MTKYLETQRASVHEVDDNRVLFVITTHPPRDDHIDAEEEMWSKRNGLFHPIAVGLIRVLVRDSNLKLRGSINTKILYDWWLVDKFATFFCHC